MLAVIGVVCHHSGMPGVQQSNDPTPIRHVLFDADGVLQVVPGGGWFALAEPYLGERAEEFMVRSWHEEIPSLTGQAEFLPFLAALLTEYDVDVPVEQVFADVWCRIEHVRESLDVVAALRHNGYGLHLGTNQDDARGAYMRANLGYEQLFDTTSYSDQLGFAKPDPAFFVEVSRRIGAEPASILFVDDMSKNVDGARAAGLAAERWTVDDGHPALLDLLARHGVDGSLTTAAATI